MRPKILLALTFSLATTVASAQNVTATGSPRSSVGGSDKCTAPVAPVVPNGRTASVSNLIQANRDVVAFIRASDDYQKMFQVLKTLPCDLFLGAHGAYYGLDEKHARLKSMKPGDPNPFIDPDGYRKFVTSKEQEFKDKLAAASK